MAIFTSAELSEQKTAWKAALLAVSTSQSYTIGKRTLTRADLPEIRKMLEWLDKLESEASAAGSGPLFVEGRIRR